VSEINDLSDAYVAAFARQSPMMATFLGVPGDPDRIDDLSPQGLAERHELVLGTLQVLAAAGSTGTADDIARDVLVERLEVERDIYDSGWAHAALNVIASPLQQVRLVFDLMPTASNEDVAVLARRMAAVPAALAGYRQSLLAAADRGKVAAVRQVDKCAGQCDTYAGVGGTGFFSGLAASVDPTGARGEALTAELTAGAAVADAAYAELGEFLRSELRPHAPGSDAVGRDRYALASRDFLGAVIDLEETYDWGWAEFLAIEAEMLQVAERIAPGWTPTRPTRSPGRTRCAVGCSTSPIGQSPTCPTLTSRSPTRSRLSSA